MAYMVYQRYTTAVLEAYSGRPDVAERLEEARSYRLWLESLDIEAKVREGLVEQALTLEAAFERLARTS